jgi:hypothetical protein
MVDFQHDLKNWKNQVKKLLFLRSEDFLPQAFKIQINCPTQFQMTRH